MTNSLQERSITKHLLLYLKAGLGIILLLVVFYSVNIAELQRIILQSRPWWLVISLVATFVTLDFQVWLFGYVASPFAKIPHIKLITFTLIGRFFSLLLPSSVGGDLIKGLYLLPYFPDAFTTYAAVVVQRALGGLSTLLVGIIVGLMFLPDNLRVQFVQVMAAGVAVVSVAGFIAWIGRVRVIRFLRALKSTAPEKLINAVQAFISALSLYRNQQSVLFIAFLVSGMTTALAAWVFMLLAYTLRIELSFVQSVVIASFTMLSVVIPLTPGGVGVSEGAFVLTATAMGVDREEALAIALLSRILGYICSLPGGVLFIFVRMRHAIP